MTGLVVNLAAISPDAERNGSGTPETPEVSVKDGGVSRSELSSAAGSDGDGGQEASQGEAGPLASGAAISSQAGPGGDGRAQAAEVKVTGRVVNRAEVSFEAGRDDDGRPLITLTLTRDGKPAAGNRMFTLDLAPSLTAEDVDVLVGALNRCITHLGMAAPEPPAAGEEAS